MAFAIRKRKELRLVGTMCDNQHNRWDAGERESVSQGADAFFDNVVYTTTLGYFRNKLVSTCSTTVDPWAIWQRMGETHNSAAEFPVKTNHVNSESSVEIHQVVYLFVLFENCFNLPIRKMCECGKANGVADSEEEWNLIHKKDVSQKDQGPRGD